MKNLLKLSIGKVQFSSNLFCSGDCKDFLPKAISMYYFITSRVNDDYDE